MREGGPSGWTAGRLVPAASGAPYRPRALAHAPRQHHPLHHFGGLLTRPARPKIRLRAQVVVV